MMMRQKKMLLRMVFVLSLTAASVLGIINFRDWVNRTEAMRTLKGLAVLIEEFRNRNGFVPPQSWVHQVVNRLPGEARLGDFSYRGYWIRIDSKPDEILAYSRKKANAISFFTSGFAVIRLGGEVEWLGEAEFEKTIAYQQSKAEIEILESQKRQEPVLQIEPNEPSKIDLPLPLP